MNADREALLSTQILQSSHYRERIGELFRGSLVVLALRDSRLPSLQSKLAEIEAAVMAVKPGTVIHIGD